MVNVDPERHFQMQSRPRRLVTVIGTVILVGVGCILGAAFAEAGYRAFLAYAYPERFERTESDFATYNVSHWEFDEQFGYVYPPGRTIDHMGMLDGYVNACSRFSVINRYGNIGPVAGDWENAQLKIAVFGDSWTAFHHDGKTWPHFLQDLLEQRLGKKVAVMNFGRDGYGVLQIFDLAAGKIAEWKPDVAIMTFITDDLTRARFWRTVVGEGDDQRVVTTTDPVKRPREDRSADTYLLMASATYEWCEKMRQAKQPDDVLRRLIEKHRRILSRSSDKYPIARVRDFDHSYLVDRLLRGNPFWTVDRRMQVAVDPRNPRMDLHRYSDDPRFVENLAKIKASGAQWMLFHLAFYPEIKANREYTTSRQDDALLESLEQVTGKKVLRTTDFVSMPVERPERMNATPDDSHPSLWGMEFYANAVAKALMQERLVEHK